MAIQGLKPGTVIGNRYRIERLLGSGGIGIVYLARDLAGESARVAVKVLTSRDPVASEAHSLREEFSVLSRLRHPNLVQILNFGVFDSGGAPYLVEEFVDGVDLVQATEARVTKDILRLMAVLCRVVQFLHTRGIIHGDLKASNVLLGAECDPAKLKVLDFGLAVRPEEPRKISDAGTLAYAPPEVLLGKGTGTRSDLYSLGVLFYQLLARRLPFEDQDAGFLIQKQLQGLVDLRPIERMEYGAGLAQIVRALLEKDPGRRPSSAEDVIRLLSVASGEDYSGKLTVPLESYFSAGSFVGRDKELAHLQELARGVRESGRGTTEFILGEGGSGKSRCMEELKIWALLEGWRVVEGSCQAKTEQSYGAYRQVLALTEGSEEVDAGTPEEGPLFKFGETTRAEDFGSFEASTEIAAGQFRDRLTREIVRRLSRRPTILMLHDCHWADEATAAVLEYLTADVQAHPTFLCVSVRTGEAEREPVRRLIESSVRQLRAETMTIEALGGDAVRTLVESMTGEADLAHTVSPWVWKASGGNPFFVEEILKHLVDQGFLHREAGKWKLKEKALDLLEVPKSIAVVLRQRLENLSPRARELASWITVAGASARVEELRRVVNWRPDEFEGGLEELSARQMIRREENEGPESIEFRHALISEVIREDLNARERRRMHLRIGEALELTPSDEGRTQTLAMHFTEARAGEKAVEYALKAAAECRAVYANETALHFLEYVLKYRGLLTREQLCQVAIDAADSCCALGIPRRGIALLSRQMARCKSVSTLVKSQLLAQLVFSYQHFGEIQRVATLARKGLRKTYASKLNELNVVRATFLTYLGYYFMVTSRPRAGLRQLNDALAALHADGNHPLVGRIYALISAIQRVACTLRPALAAASKAVAILERRDLAYLPVAYSHLGVCLVALGRFDKALPYHRRAVEVSGRTRSINLRSQALCNLAECLCRSGASSEAISYAEQAVLLARESGNPAILHSCLATQAEVGLCRGDYLKAKEVLEELNSFGDPSPALYSQAHATFLIAWLNAEMGDYAQALSQLRVLTRFASSQAPIYEQELGVVLRGRILFLLGNKGRAIALLTVLRAKVIKKHWPYQACEVSLRLAEMLIGENDLHQAQRHVKNALRLAETMRCCPQMSLGHFLQGRIYTITQGLSLTGSDKPDVPFGTQVAKEAYERAAQLAERSSNYDIAWNAYAELAKLFKSHLDDESCLFNAKRALEMLSIQESRVPPESVLGFRSAFGRGKGRSEMESLVKSIEKREESTSYLAEDTLKEEHLRMLFRVSHAINSIRDWDKLLDEIVDLLTRSLGVERALLYLKDESTGIMTLAKARNLRGETLRHAEALSQSVLRDAGLQGQPFVSVNARLDPRVSSLESVISYQLGAVLCAPLRANGRIFGVIYADHSSPVGSISESTIGLFEAFCNLAAVAIDNALAHRQLVEEKTELERHLRQVCEGFPEIVGGSDAIQRLRHRTAAVADSPLDVLITGESGTGKELVARAIHKAGRRSGTSFIPADCGSFSEGLAESELFGSRKGSFTGSMESRAGLFEAANGGVLFLDEISNLPLKLQAKLLRVLQEREVRRIGETTPRTVDVQVIAATNKDLLEQIRRGRFRRDLYYRLNAAEIEVPPLREHLEDVPLLVECFLTREAKDEGKSKKFSREAMGFLCSYSYPGNVRELRNIVRNCYYTTRGPVVGVEDLPREVTSGDRSVGTAAPQMTGDQIYRRIRKGDGDFEQLVKKQFMKRNIGKESVCQIIRWALVESGGRYREALRLLRIPQASYSVTIQFLKRNGCYLDFRPFRKESRTAKKD